MPIHMYTICTRYPAQVREDRAPAMQKKHCVQYRLASEDAFDEASPSRSSSDNEGGGGAGAVFLRESTESADPPDAVSQGEP